MAPGNPYVDILDVDAVRLFSMEEDSECFLGLARVLHSHKRADRFVVTLLHNHFPIDNGEGLLREISLDQRGVLVSVGALESFPQDSREVSWRVMPDGEMAPLQWSKGTAGGFLLDAGDRRCIDEAACVLAHNSSLLRFGLALALDLPRTEDEYILEQTFVDTREQTLEIRPRSELESMNTIQTSWRLPEPAVIEAAWGCTKKVNSWCLSSCETRCKEGAYSHDSQHRGARHKRQSEKVHHS